MKLLLDQNLSPRLVHEFTWRLRTLESVYPGSAHVREFGLQAAEDIAIWNFAKENQFVIVSKDSDFHQMSFLYGPPPKVVWLRLGNCSTAQVLESLSQNSDRLEAFLRDEQAAFLVLE